MPNGDVTPDSLIRAIESVQDRIKHDLDLPRPITGANEDRTRHALIDPLLGALGWSDPLVLTPQYLVRYGLGEYEYRVPDYALHLPDDISNPIAFLEAKRMNEPLTSDHRKKLFEATKYARDKGVGVQYCILTNGDRWDLYEPTNGGYRRILSLSIRNQPASECANLLLDHFPKPPGFETAGSANRPEVAIPVASESNALSPAPAVQTHPASESPQKADFAKPLAWFAVCLSSFGLVGWITGVLTAQPNQSILVYVGVFGVAGIVFASILLVKRFFPSVLPVTIKSLISTLSLASTTSGNTAKTRNWIVLAMVCGAGGGGVLGHFIGLWTAQPVAEFLDALGALTLLLGAIVAGVAIGTRFWNKNAGR